MLGLDLVVITDNRGFESGFFWSDVQQFVGVYEHDEWVRVKFRNDREGCYTLKLKMSIQEFIEQVKKQLDEFKKQVEEQLKPPIPDTFLADEPVTGIETS